MSWEKDWCITHIPHQVFSQCRKGWGRSNKDKELTVLTSLVPMIPPISPRSFSSKFKISVALFFWWLLSSCNWPSSLWVAVRVLWKGLKAEVTLPSADWAPVLLWWSRLLRIVSYFPDHDWLEVPTCTIPPCHNPLSQLACQQGYFRSIKCSKSSKNLICIRHVKEG